MQAARRVAARYPKVPVRFVLTGEPWHVNAKVSTLELMERTAAHDIFVVSDSDVRVSRNYIREVVAPFAEKSVGAVTCLYRGVADQGLWSKLEAAGMSIEMTAGVLVADLMEGMQFTLGRRWRYGGVACARLADSERWARIAQMTLCWVMPSRAMATRWCFRRMRSTT